MKIKYKTNLYKDVEWRNSAGGKLYRKFYSSSSITGRIYTKTYRAPVHSDINKKVLSYFSGLAPNSVIVDIGGNTGSFESEKIREIIKKHRYIRLDIDSESSPDIVGNAISLPIKDESADMIICKSVLEHLSEPWKCADEMHRILKKGGRLYVYTPFFQRVHASPNDYYRFTKSGLLFLFRKFAKAEINSNGGYFSSLGNVVFLGTFPLDSVYSGWLARAILWPIFRIAVLLDRFDKYRLNTIGYFGLFVK